jgi:hypothetical protein
MTHDLATTTYSHTELEGFQSRAGVGASCQGAQRRQPVPYLAHCNGPDAPQWLLEWDELSIEKTWQVWEGALNDDRYEAEHCSQGLLAN